MTAKLINFRDAIYTPEIDLEAENRRFVVFVYNLFVRIYHQRLVFDHPGAAIEPLDLITLLTEFQEEYPDVGSFLLSICNEPGEHSGAAIAERFGAWSRKPPEEILRSPRVPALGQFIEA